MQIPGADGTLLAVVPIPGTGTSLAIVGYPVAPGGTVPVGQVPEGLVRDGQALVGADGVGSSQVVGRHIGEIRPAHTRMAIRPRVDRQPARSRVTLAHRAQQVPREDRIHLP